jgi:Family of unknown function (DUF6152)
MKTKLLTVLAMLVCLSGVAPPGFAHHGSAAYDMTKLVTVKATVTNLMWANPHTMLNFDVKDEKGGVTHWALEMFNPLWMTRSGWTKDTLKPGDEIEVTFHPAKNGSGNGYVRLPESKIIFHGQSINMDEAGASAAPSKATY